MERSYKKPPIFLSTLLTQPSPFRKQLLGHATISPSDAKGLHVLQEESNGSFVRGLILYPGSEIVPLGKNCHAIPITSLWN